jgi:hypothetical protein
MAPGEGYIQAFQIDTATRDNILSNNLGKSSRVVVQNSRVNYRLRLLRRKTNLPAGMSSGVVVGVNDSSWN